MYAMKSFRILVNKLNEEEEKNTHLEHIEDLVFNEGVVGTRKAILFLIDLKKMLSSNSDKKITTTLKWDGAPAVFVGVDPQDKKFFVAKKSLFNKVPKVYKSVEEINADTSGDLAEKLIAVFNFLHTTKFEPGIVFQGDLMFTKSDLQKKTIEGEDYITFQPNTIMYAMPFNSQAASEVIKSKLGIVWHTKYKGDSLSSFKVVGRVTMSDLPIVPNVWMRDAEYKDYSGVVTLSAKESNMLDKLLSKIGQLFRNLNASVIEDIKSNQDLKLLVKTFNNSLIRNSKIISNKSYADNLKNYIQGRYNDKISQAKTEKAKLSVINNFKSSFKYFENHKVKDINIMDLIVRMIATAKTIIINKLNKASKIKTFLRTKNGFRVTTPEGYVAINNSGNMVKLVDRLEFSMANFSPDIIKGWER